jgi:hypothetical protein
MFDANYFRTALHADIEAAGGAPVVELSLLNGHVHRVHAVVAVADGYVSLSVHPTRGDLSHERPRYGTTGLAGESVRVTVSYDSIAAVLFDPAPEQVKARPGFASR